MKYWLVIPFLFLTVISCSNLKDKDSKLNQTDSTSVDEKVIALSFHEGFNTTNAFIGSDVRSIYQSSRFNKGLSSSIDRNGMSDILTAPECVNLVYESIIVDCDTISPDKKNKPPLLEVHFFSFRDAQTPICYFYRTEDIKKLFKRIIDNSKGKEECKNLIELSKFYYDSYQ